MFVFHFILFVFFVLNLIACTSTFGSKAKLTSADDVLQVDADTYLSEIDNLDSGETITSERKTTKAGGLTGGFGSAKTTGELPARGLFPHSPRKIGTSVTQPRLKSKVIVINNNKPVEHRNSNTVIRSKQRRAAEYDSHRSKLNRVVEKVQQQNHSRNKHRQIAFIATPPQSARNQTQAKPSLFARYEPSFSSSLNSYRIQKRPIQVRVPNKTDLPKILPEVSPPIAPVGIQKTFVDVGIQTEPCRCQVRNKIKNRNRRNAHKMAKIAA